ncbi:MAG: L,D-transpeptidase [Candidatus Dormibacteria bacterium]
MAITAAAPVQAPRRSFAVLRLWPRALLLLLIAAIVAVAVLTTAISGAVAAFKVSENGLVRSVQTARAAGYTDQDLKPILVGLAALQSAPAPRIGERLSFYQRQKAAADDLRAQLSAVEASALAGYRQQLDGELSATRSGLDQARTAGVDDLALAPFQKILDGVNTSVATAGSALQLRKLITDISPVAVQLDAMAKQQASENSRVAQAVAALKGAHPNDIEAIRHEGLAPLAAGRNDGTLAAFLKLPTLDRYTSRLEAAAATLSGGDLELVTRAAALAQVRGADLHSALMAAMPEKVIAVSLSGQHMWAYEQGKIVQDTLITTGRPALPTDIGPMTVLRKSSPWKMHSPWSRASQYWYPDTVVRKVVWFTDTGEGFHDANWEPLSLYGPGGQFTSSASHGCIHMPGTTVDFLFDWAPVGAPVIVIPGDGSPTATQVAADTIDLPSAQYVAHGS